MIQKTTRVFLIALLVPLTAFAHGSLRFLNGLWYDGQTFQKKTMYSVEGVLQESFEGEAREVDLAGRYVVPPLGDAHNHLFADGDRFDDQLARCLRQGVFYVKNPNNTAAGAARVRARLGTPESVDALFANGGITSPGGHPAQIYDRVGPGMEGQAYHEIASAHDLDAKWEAIRAGKLDFLKVYLEHSEEHARRRDDAAFYGQRGLDPALLTAIVARAHAGGLRVTAHVTTAADFRAALASGVDEIAHLPLEALAPADAQLAARLGVTVVTTVLSHRPHEGVADPAALHRENLRLLSGAGVRIALGVDGDPSVLDEIEAVARLGVFTNAEILRMAVVTTPRAIFPGRKIGSLAEGMEASLIALDGNPLEDLRALRRVTLRVKQGHVLEVAPEKRSVAEALMPLLMSEGTEKAIAEYRRLEKEEAAAWDFTEPRLNQLGYALLAHGKSTEAVRILELNAEKFPGSSNVWDSLGEALLATGDRERAIAAYRRALKIDPKNASAEKMLRKILSED